jgi:GAF domain-containing protein
MIANAANTSALLFDLLPDLNWAGFYLMKDGGLVLGPFQGKPACIRIPLGRGVCGTAAATRASQLVADVHEFPGHIACDAASRSELVVPLLHGDRLVGVIDLDSPLPGRFDADDQAGIEAVAAIFIRSL